MRQLTPVTTYLGRLAKLTCRAVLLEEIDYLGADAPATTPGIQCGRPGIAIRENDLWAVGYPRGHDKSCS